MVRKTSQISLLVITSQVFPGFYSNISFWKLFLGDFAKKERTREARGILFAGHNAVFDGFFDHLQRKKKIGNNEPQTPHFMFSSSLKPSLVVTCPTLSCLFHQCSSFVTVWLPCHCTFLRTLSKEAATQNFIYLQWKQTDYRYFDPVTRFCRYL